MAAATTAELWPAVPQPLLIGCRAVWAGLDWLSSPEEERERGVVPREEAPEEEKGAWLVLLLFPGAW